MITAPVDNLPEVSEDDEPTEIAPNLVPSLDQAEPLATYQDWDPKDTKVVVYFIGGSPRGSNGLWALTRDNALRQAKLTYGRVFEANYVPGRAFFRVKRGG
jgi:hypothetical protein